MTITIILKIKPDTEEISSWYKDHHYKYDGDIGLDLFCAKDTIVEAGSQHEIDFGITCELIVEYKLPKLVEHDTFFLKRWVNGMNDYEYVSELHQDGLPFMLIPRSSISKTPLMMCNSVGIIDRSYRGALKAPIFNSRMNAYYKVEKKDRLFQLVLFNALRIDKIEIVDKLSETTRGTAGFGSTGR